MSEYLVVAKDDAPALREALGRLFAVSINAEYPIPSDPPGADTYYYTDPKPSRDGTQCAFGPKDDFLDSVLGQSIQLGDNSTCTVPSAYVELGTEWFPEIPPP